MTFKYTKHMKRPAHFSFEEWFWFRVRKTKSCWHWIAGKNNSGYGSANYCGRPYSAHEVALILHNLTPPSSLLEVDHKCRNRGCVNPQHLRYVTRTQNILYGRSPSAKNAKKTHCARGHALRGTNLCIETGKRPGLIQRRCRKCRIERYHASK